MSWRGFVLVLFALSGLVPLLGLLGDPPTTALLIDTVFVAAWFARRPLRGVVARLPERPACTRPASHVPPS